MAKVSPDRTVYIYGLHTNCDDTVMYVGCSVNPDKRLRQHSSLAKQGYAPQTLQAWLKNCIKGDKTLTYTILAQCKAKHAAQIETAWIDKIRESNPGILNMERYRPYSSHIDADAELKDLEPISNPQPGNIVIHMRRAHGGNSKYTPITVEILRLGRGCALVAGQVNGEYREQWIPQQCLYHYEPDDKRKRKQTASEKQALIN